jgi:hypothetical protein
LERAGKWSRRNPVLAVLAVAVAILAVVSSASAIRLSLSRQELTGAVEDETHQAKLAEAATKKAEEQRGVAQEKANAAEEALAKLKEEASARSNAEAEKLAATRERLRIAEDLKKKASQLTLVFSTLVLKFFLIDILCSFHLLELSSAHRHGPLNRLVVGTGNRNGDTDGNLLLLDGPYQSLLALVQKLENPVHVGDMQSYFAGDLCARVTTVLQSADFLGSIDGRLVPASHVLNQTDQYQFLLGGLDDPRRDFGLAKAFVSFQSALPATEKVASFAVPVFVFRDSDWPLQADLGNVGHDLLELLLAPCAGVGQRDLVDRDHLHDFFFLVHAATSIFLRLDMLVK